MDAMRSLRHWATAPAEKVAPGETSAGDSEGVGADAK